MNVLLSVNWGNLKSRSLPLSLDTHLFIANIIDLFVTYVPIYCSKSKLVLFYTIFVSRILDILRVFAYRIHSYSRLNRQQNNKNNMSESHRSTQNPKDVIFKPASPSKAGIILVIIAALSNLFLFLYPLHPFSQTLLSTLYLTPSFIQFTVWIMIVVHAAESSVAHHILAQHGLQGTRLWMWYVGVALFGVNCLGPILKEHHRIRRSRLSEKHGQKPYAFPQLNWTWILLTAIFIPNPITLFLSQFISNVSYVSFMLPMSFFRAGWWWYVLIPVQVSHAAQAVALASDMHFPMPYVLFYGVCGFLGGSAVSQPLSFIFFSAQSIPNKTE